MNPVSCYRGRNTLLFLLLCLDTLPSSLSFQPFTSSTRHLVRKAPISVLQWQPDNLTAAATVAIVLFGGGSSLLWFTNEERQQHQRAIKSEYDAIRKERARLASIEPRDTWTEADLVDYDGRHETGPLLMAADGIVFNVWKGRHFYGPECAYHVMAGRDATRLLAKSKLEEETAEEQKVPLTMGERAALAGWMWTFKSKYEIVGRLEGYNPKDTSM
jgi:membrane-associated progesterone receptor component